MTKKKKDLVGNIEFYRLVSENTNDLVAISDLEGTYLYVSPSHKILGYDPAELIGSSGVDYVHPDDVELLFGLLKEAIEDETRQSDSKTLERRVKNAKGQWLLFESTIKSAVAK